MKEWIECIIWAEEVVLWRKPSEGDDYMDNKIGVHIPLALMTTYFALFFFVFADLGISMIYAYSAMAIILVFSLIFERRLLCSNIAMAYCLLAIVATFFFILPYSRHEFDVVTVIISIVLCSLLSLFAMPSEKELNSIIRIITIVGVLVSIYVIVIAIFPNLYINHISNFIASEPRANTIRMLRLKYGVIIGGNVTLINHILVLSLLILINKYFIYDVKKGRFKAVLMILLGISAVFLVNRKGELLAFALVIVYTLCFGGSISQKARLRKALKYIFTGIIVLTILIFIAVRMELANRYLRFFFYLVTNNREEMSSGRFELWSTALKLFSENPLFGIGWGNTKFYINMFNSANQTYIENVHCLLLQLLADTGLIGTILYMTPVIYIFRQMKKTVNRLKLVGNKAFLPKLLASVALEYQLFLFINGMIDSTWHRISFWPFYTTSIIMAVAAQRMANSYEDMSISIVNQRAIGIS